MQSLLGFSSHSLGCLFSATGKYLHFLGIHLSLPSFYFIHFLFHKCPWVIISNPEISVTISTLPWIPAFTIACSDCALQSDLSTSQLWSCFKLFFGFWYKHLCPTPHVSLEKELATHSSILAWRIPWTEEPGGLEYMESQRVRHNWVTSTRTPMFPWEM